MTDNELLAQIAVNTSKLVELFGKQGGGGKDAKGPVLTVTGNVKNFDEAQKKDKNGNTYHFVQLDNGFIANVFKDADLCERAYAEGIPLVIEFVLAGKYKNIVSIKLQEAPRSANPVKIDDDEIPF